MIVLRRLLGDFWENEPRLADTARSLWVESMMPQPTTSPLDGGHLKKTLTRKMTSMGTAPTDLQSVMSSWGLGM
jgi:hypothetical protein